MRVSSTRYGSHSEMSREKAAPSAVVATEVRGKLCQACAEMASEVRDSLMRLRALHRNVASSPSGEPTRVYELAARSSSHLSIYKVYLSSLG